MSKNNNAPALDSSKELPSYEALLLELGLYEEFDLEGDWAYVKRLYQGPDIQFDAYCVSCEKESTFKQYVGLRGGGAGERPQKDETYLDPQIIKLEFHCQRKPKHQYYYILQIERQSIAKIGQSPSLATIAASRITRFKKLLDEDYLRDLNRAIGLFAHGIGAGSFVYLRRIFEHLLHETAETARKDRNPLDGFENSRMDEKIKALNNYLPDEVVRTAGIYSVLSVGIHTLSERECLALFPVMRTSIEFILDGHLALKKRHEHQRELERALKATSKIVENAKKLGIKASSSAKATT